VKKRLLLLVCLAFICVSIGAFAKTQVSDQEGIWTLDGRDFQELEKAQQKNVEKEPKQSVLKPHIVDKPIEWNETRIRLIHEYAQIHYGKDIDTIVPQMIVLHWTAADNWEGTYNYFYHSEGNYTEGGKLNVASHYLVDRDGTIYQLTPETALNRHAIGYNWCAIGVENVGGVNGREDLTEEQIQANIALVKYLSAKYSTIRYVIGHYQQDKARSTGLYIENLAGYHSDKIDPGAIFMSRIHAAFDGTDLIFFKE